jgi:hypothetical protein
MAILSSCGIKWSQRYDIAVTDLGYRFRQKELELVSEAEIKEHAVLLHNKDTFRIKNDRKNFGIRNKSTNEIYLFQFGLHDSYRMIHCDSVWQIISFALNPVEVH